MKKLLSNRKLFIGLVTCLVLLPFLTIFMAPPVINYLNERSLQAYREELEKAKPKPTYEELEPASTDNIYMFEKYPEFVLMNGRPNQYLSKGGHYFYTYDQKILKTKNGDYLLDDEKKIPKSDYWKVILYDLDSPQLAKKEVDINKVVSAYTSDYFAIGVEVIEYKNNPKNILKIKVKNKKNAIKYLDFDLDSMKMEGEAEERSDTYDHFESIDLLRTTFYEGVQDKGYLVNESIANYSGVNKKAFDTNINLYLVYPELEEKMVKNKRSLYPRERYFDNEKWYSSLLYWFAPKGEAQLPVYGLYSDNTKSETLITTYSELETWVKEHPEERKVKDETN